MIETFAWPGQIGARLAFSPAARMVGRCLVLLLGALGAVRALGLG